jgi:hypothetical protein
MLNFATCMHHAFMLHTQRDHYQSAALESASLQVKLLKCLVDNVVVDISFNQIGGLCTLTFLESIDRRVGKAHLFKKSIILVGSPMSAVAAPH